MCRYHSQHRLTGNAASKAWAGAGQGGRFRTGTGIKPQLFHLVSYEIAIKNVNSVTVTFIDYLIIFGRK